MKSKIRTIGITIISILLLVLISIIIYNVVYLPSIKEDKQLTNNENNTPVEHLSIDGKSLEICKDGVDCGFGTRNYYTISTDIVDEQLTNVIDDLNTKINNSYTRSLNATDMTASECSNVSNLYQRSIMTESILNIYDSENLLGITLISSESNLCLFTNIQEIPEEFLSFAREIYDSYGHLTGDELERINHQETPWIEARGECKPWENCSNEISEESMKLFYRKMMV